MDVYNCGVVRFVINSSGVSLKRKRLIDILINLMPRIRIIRAMVLSFPFKLVDIGCVRNPTLAVNLKDRGRRPLTGSLRRPVDVLLQGLDQILIQLCVTTPEDLL
jgi:hypothetical protein